MYLKHFGLSQYPFTLTPDTRFFLKLPVHDDAFLTVLETMTGPGGFITVVGSVGNGKTMFCRKILNALDMHTQRYTTAFIPHPVLDDSGILFTLADELDTSLEDADLEDNARYHGLLKKINLRLSQECNKGKKVVVFIDEAQAIPIEALKELALLDTIDSAQASPVYIVLFGQPELDQLLNQPNLSCITDKIRLSCRLPALGKQDLYSYVSHRLLKAGYNGPQLFTLPAMNLLYRMSEGIPRLINVLCHKALLSAYGRGDDKISTEHIQAACSDTESIGVNYPQA